ncbi:MAG: hypothetical protein QN198_05170 [Armatimonadota bacterium]|nr:hypothetical protein [Armatimonadota bacterium]MDR5702976.1 hypothetical protein [Armatimonadota bacterium]MDR7435792.1 hypothetical protein [Armatimonadota bacterium]
MKRYEWAVLSVAYLILVALPAYGAPNAEGGTILNQAQGVLDELSRLEVLLSEKLDELQEAILEPLRRFRTSQRVLETIGSQLRRFPEMLEEAVQRWLEELRQILSVEGSSALYGVYGQANPKVVRKAKDLARSEMAAVGGTVQSVAAARVSLALARHAAQESTIRRAAREAQDTAHALSREAPTIPSTRAGIQLLVAGQAEGLRFQAVLGRTLGNRLAGVSQQLASLSQQNAALQNVLSQQLLLQAREQEESLKATLVQLDLVRTLAVQTYIRGVNPFLEVTKDEEEDLLNLVRWEGK